MGAAVTTPIRKLGSWVSRTANTVYQAATDGFACFEGIGNTPFVDGYSDANNPPTTYRRRDSRYGSGAPCGITMPVKKNDYWKIDITNITSYYIYWIPLKP